MSGYPTGFHSAPALSSLRRTALLAIALIGVCPPPSTAAADPFSHTPAAMGGDIQFVAHSPSPSFQPLLADWLDKILDPIISGMRGRQRTLQVGALMMVLALAVIWWRK